MIADFDDLYAFPDPADLRSCNPTRAKVLRMCAERVYIPPSLHDNLSDGAALATDIAFSIGCPPEVFELCHTWVAHARVLLDHRLPSELQRKVWN